MNAPDFFDLKQGVGSSPASGLQIATPATLAIAGGQPDPNMQVLADRLAARGIPFTNLLTGPEARHDLRIDLQAGTMMLNGHPIRPSGCFIRHNVFLLKSEKLDTAQAAALNWYHAILGWLTSQPSVRLFNRHTYLQENNKIRNLLLARQVGLAIPDTLVTNDFAEFGGKDKELIQKPVAGGEYTSLIGDLARDGIPYPRFIQPRLNRPEMRIYRIGTKLLAFRLQSPDLDYRRTQDVQLAQVPVPAELGAKLTRLCDMLDLDFAAADFMMDHDGNMVFLEVNTQPMFAAFDRLSGGQVSDAIIDFLIGEQQPAGSITN